MVTWINLQKKPKWETMDLQQQQNMFLKELSRAPLRRSIFWFWWPEQRNRRNRPFFCYGKYWKIYSKYTLIADSPIIGDMKRCCAPKIDCDVTEGYTQWNHLQLTKTGQWNDATIELEQIKNHGIALTGTRANHHSSFSKYLTYFFTLQATSLNGSRSLETHLCRVWWVC